MTNISLQSNLSTKLGNGETHTSDRRKGSSSCSVAFVRADDLSLDAVCNVATRWQMDEVLKTLKTKIPIDYISGDKSIIHNTVI